MVPKLLKAETSRHPWLLFFLLIPYHKVLHFIWKCTLSLSFSHFSISPAYIKTFRVGPLLRFLHSCEWSFKNLSHIHIIITLKILQGFPFTITLCAGVHKTLHGAEPLTASRTCCSATFSFQVMEHVKLTLPQDFCTHWFFHLSCTSARCLWG